ncbi:NLI interacting factor-like phosphatase family protein [Tritrichomonas foetus]|uniref:Mitochondrial import inner membrane translocase subunit TIM50 n=1 Tax=Tritrichomonas foetus TaxID=1144522 RepID=A0A1J4K1J0_9EUKA|nr:NLI interacting factor-like phosphatase family protein [Tritrichomonas foetus]|eukprot:OHT04826.1 NLI interacting factor-like phosphatase family protein [Tritrichomonas foetus]
MQETCTAFNNPITDILISSVQEIPALMQSVVSLRPVLVLDLDETLVYSSPLKMNSDSIPIRVGRRRVFVQFRPGLFDFLQAISQIYEIFFFTASAEAYANQIIDRILPETPVNHRFFRQSCRCFHGYPVKDLNLINRPLNKVLIVDDLEGSALLHLNNLVRISPWIGDPNDQVLINQLLPALQSSAFESDIPKAFQKMAERNMFTDLSSPKLVM